MQKLTAYATLTTLTTIVFGCSAGPSSDKEKLRTSTRVAPQVNSDSLGPTGRLVSVGKGYTTPASSERQLHGLAAVHAGLVRMVSTRDLVTKEDIFTYEGAITHPEDNQRHTASLKELLPSIDTDNDFLISPGELKVAESQMYTGQKVCDLVGRLGYTLPLSQGRAIIEALALSVPGATKIQPSFRYSISVTPGEHTNYLRKLLKKMDTDGDRVLLPKEVAKAKGKALQKVIKEYLARQIRSQQLKLSPLRPQ
jgi:hypothetical protein